MDFSVHPNDLLKEVEELRKTNALLKAKNQSLLQQIQTLQADVSATANELEVSIDQFRLMSDSLPVIIWTADADGSVDYFNKRWYDFTGQTKDMPHGWGWQPVIHPDDLQRTLDTWNTSLRTEMPYEIEYRFKRGSDGAYLWYLGNAIPLRDKDGKVLKWFGTGTDIQDQKEAENKKNEFISIASHELKTPLTTVKAFVQMAKGILSPDHAAAGFITKATLQLTRLEKLISDLLDVSKINAGKMNYNLEKLNFSTTLHETVESVQQTAPQHTIVIEVNEDVTITGDRLRLEQVINNLLTNAIKYSPNANTIVVRSELQQNNLVVSVQDFGIGIAPENLKHLFECYYRVDNTAARFQGLGLGLFISSEIVKRHGGSFWIESEEGQGSTFYFLIPVVDSNNRIGDSESDEVSYYKSDFLELKYNADKQWIEADWLGYQSYDTVMHGCNVMLHLLQKNNCKQVMNDNSHVTGNWSEASDWVSESWFPAMKEAGLSQFAWIQSASTFSRMSANKSATTSSHDNSICFFNNREDAANWLTAQKEQ